MIDNKKSVGSEIKSFPTDTKESMEKLDKERYLKRVIIVCWIALAICFGIKLFGGNLFEIMCENENFIKVCEYADNHFWANYLIYLIYAYVTLYFLTLAMISEWKFTKVQFIMFTITAIVGVFIKLLNSQIGLVFDIWQIIIMPILFVWHKKRQIFWIILGNIILVVFQIVSMFVKNLSIGIVTQNGVLITTIYSIDVSIMICLYYFYSNIMRKEKKDGSNSCMVSM